MFVVRAFLILDCVSFGVLWFSVVLPVLLLIIVLLLDKVILYSCGYLVA